MAGGEGQCTYPLQQYFYYHRVVLGQLESNQTLTMKGETEEDERCAVCGSVPEDILMLECNHDLCVECALRGYRSKESGQSMFICEICHKKTLLDKETIRFLNAATQQKSLKGEARGEKEGRGTQKPKIPKQPKSQKRICIAHREQLLYYCFDCESEEICSECILEQKHMGHNVSTVKKAVQKIKGMVIAQLKEKELVQSKLQHHHAALKEISSSFKNHVESKRKEIRYYYESLKRIIDNHYERIIKEFGEVSGRAENALLSQVARCCTSLENLREAMEEIRRGVNQSQELGVLRKLGFRRQVEGVGKVDVGFPEFQHSDISAELADKLGQFSITLPRAVHTSPSLNSNIKQTHPLPQPRPEQNHHLNLPYNPNQTRIKNVMNSSSHSFRNSYLQTPLKPEVSRSINTASELISRLQSRQRNFD